jgi:hypothetical protein
MKILTIIDADSLIYQSSKQDLKESIDIIDEKIENIFSATQADYYCMFISLGTYFRHKVNPTYKSNRKVHTSPLLWVKTLKNYLIERYGAIASRDVEADDLCKHFYNKEYVSGQPFHMQMSFDGEMADSLFIKSQDQSLSLNTEDVKVILASPDKDLLKSMTGTHFNYTYRLEDKENPDSLIKGTWVVTEKEDADMDIWYKMIEGDASDGIAGLHGKGKAFATKIYKDATKEEIPGICIREYIKYYKGNVSEALMRFQENYRMLYILEDDGDFLREVGYLPEFSYRCVESPVEVVEINDNQEEEEF